MLLTRQRLLLLAGTVLFFALVVAGYIWWRVDFKSNHFRTGLVPQELVNQLLPKDIPLDSMRPPAIRVTDPIRYGGATSVISVIEYGDFECPYCKQLAPEIKKALEAYRGDVRFVWRDYPITSLHPHAMDAAIFARCAAVQGRFWEAYDALMSATNLNESLYQQIAARAGLNASALSSCRNNPSVKAALEQDVEEANADGIHSAPFLFIGTTAIDEFIDAETITKAISEAHVGL
ncbi:MAG: thioredoxin domain-containing protein [Patescibacteria group bacterium]